MKIFNFLLVTVTSFLFFFSQSAFSAYGTDAVADDDSEKTTTHGAEVEVNEFVLLDAMPNIGLYYYPYTATDADTDASEDVPGGAGRSMSAAVLLNGIPTSIRLLVLMSSH